MGYYTDYEVTVTGPSEALKEFEEAADAGETTLDDVEYSYMLKGMEFNAKWYHYDRDMLSVSKRFPELLFVIEANGEESGDIWRAYFRNGKQKRIEPEMNWPEVDFDKELPAPVVSDAEHARRERIAQLEQELQTLKNRKLI